MLYTTAAAFFILWLLGFVNGYLLDGYLHLLIVAALVMVLLNSVSDARDRERHDHQGSSGNKF